MPAEEVPIDERSQPPAPTKQLPKVLRPQHILRLYIAGASPRSTQALRNVREICRTHLADSDVLQVVDIYQQPALAAADAVTVAPTLIRKLPKPECRLMGDMSNMQEIVNMLRVDVTRAHRAG